MFPFKVIQNEAGEITHIEPSVTGSDLLSSPKLNKGCAFTPSERDTFRLTGLLPYQVETLEQQVTRMYMQFGEHHTNLGKNIYLHVLHDYNETLFYRLVLDHLEEMLPIIYTPTVGEAVQRFSTEHRKTKGLYIAYEDRHRMDEILENRLPPAVDLAVVTDGEAVLGIGDQGIGGINISIAKLMVYGLCGGLHPYRFLPIQLDVGTNNPQLLNDPMYLGWRHERISGAAYDDFIETFVTSIKRKFPSILLHWEDIGKDNARRLLNRYRESICSLNGDIQSTGVVALASILAGVEASGVPLTEHRVVIFGAGTAGVGIADQIHQAMMRAGLSEQEAYKRFWLIDRDGLLMSEQALSPAQMRYVKTRHHIADWTLPNENNISLQTVVEFVKPTILVGCSTVAGSFNEAIIKTIAKSVPRPIILPLSNPNSLSEADPEQVLEWTDGKAIIATGSPFPGVRYQGQQIRIAQSNNALAFPGIGLGAIAVKAKYISDDMLWAATQALANCSPAIRDPLAPVLPKLSESRHVSFAVALAVAEAARAEGLATIDDAIDIKSAIQQLIWEPHYLPYRKGF